MSSVLRKTLFRKHWEYGVHGRLAPQGVQKGRIGLGRHDADVLELPRLVKELVVPLETVADGHNESIDMTLAF